MNRGVDRQRIFFADDDRIEFGRQLVSIHDVEAVETLAYCLMGNHFHLLLRSPEGSLSDAMHRLGSTYTRRTNDRIGRDGPLFRGRFLSIPVETDDYLLWVTRYIHRNPLDLPGVASPGDHRWSSYRSYLGLRPIPSFLDTGTVLSYFGGRIDRFADFTEDDGTHLGPRDTAGPRCIGDIRRLIALALAVDEENDDRNPPVRPGIERTLLVLAAHEVADPDVRGAIRTWLDHPSRAAERSAVSRAERRRRADPYVDRLLTWLLAQMPAPSPSTSRSRAS